MYDTLNESSIDKRDSIFEHNTSFSRSKFGGNLRAKNDKLERYMKEVEFLKKQIIDLRSENQHCKTQLGLNLDFRPESLSQIYESI
jgi:cell shape-determining protein MreC